MPHMIYDRFQVVESYPALYVDDLDAVLISDLHLGLESLMAKSGTYMPKVQLDAIKDDIEAIVEAVSPEKLVVCGDIKHEFSKTTPGEREEVQEFVDFLSGLVADIVFIQGNHDNFIHYYVEDYDNVILEERYVLDDILFVHGHELQEDLQTLDADYVVMGHEHPALALKDDVGITEKIDCFLYGEMDDGRKLIVLPAFSRLADGSAVNEVKHTAEDLLSPILKNKIDVSTMQTVGVDREAGVFPFPAEIDKI